MNRSKIISKLEELTNSCQAILNDPSALHRGERSDLSTRILEFLKTSKLMSQEDYEERINYGVAFLNNDYDNAFIKTRNMKNLLISLKDKIELEDTDDIISENTSSETKLTSKERYDIFICHVMADKKEIAEPLASALKNNGISVWYDDYELKWGKSLRQTIEKGLISSKFGIVLLSKSFLDNEGWGQKELSAILNDDKLLPVWYKVSFEEVKERMPIIADLYAKRMYSPSDIPTIVTEVKKFLTPKVSKVYRSEPVGSDKASSYVRTPLGNRPNFSYNTSKTSLKPITFCSLCGAIPGESTICPIDDMGHEWVKGGNVFCSLCGAVPGKSTICPIDDMGHEWVNK